MINETRYLETDEEIKIGFDPYKLRIMWIYTSSPESMTSKQVADKLGEAPSKVHYHIKKLVEHNFLELIETRNINGIIAKYYQRVYKGFRMSPKVINNPIFKVYYDNAQVETLDTHYSILKTNFIHYFDNFFESGESPLYECGSIFPTLYMTAEEAADFVDNIGKLVQKYSEKDNNKNKYKSLLALVLLNRKEE